MTKSMHSFIFLLFAFLAWPVILVNSQELGVAVTPLPSNGLEWFGSDMLTKCKSCEIDCESSFLFSKCKARYYRYGCHIQNPCLSITTANRYQFHAAVSFCISFNGCELFDFINSPVDYDTFLPFSSVDEELQTWVAQFNGNKQNVVSMLQSYSDYVTTRAKLVSTFCDSKKKLLKDNNAVDKLKSVCNQLSSRVTGASTKLSQIQKKVTDKTFKLADISATKLAALKALNPADYMRIYRDEMLQRMKPALPSALYLYYKFSQDFKTDPDVPLDELEAINENLPGWLADTLQYRDIEPRDFDGIQAQNRYLNRQQVRMDLLFEFINSWASTNSFAVISLQTQLHELNTNLKDELIGCYEVNSACKQLITSQKEEETLNKRNGIKVRLDDFDKNLNDEYTKMLRQFAIEAKLRIQEGIDLSLVNLKDLFFTAPSVSSVVLDTNLKLDKWQLTEGAAYPSQGKAPTTLNELKKMSPDDKLHPPAPKQDAITFEKKPIEDTTIYCGDRIMLYNAHTTKYLTATQEERCSNTIPNVGVVTGCASFKTAEPEGQIWLVENCISGTRIIPDSIIQLRSEFGTYLNVDKNGKVFSNAVQQDDSQLNTFKIRAFDTSATILNDRSIIGLKAISNPVYVESPEVKGNEMVDAAVTALTKDVLDETHKLELVKVGSLTPPYQEGITTKTFKCGDKIVIRSAHGSYLTADPKGCEADTTSGCARFIDPQPLGQVWVITNCVEGQVIQKGSTISLRSEYGNYLSCVPGGQSFMNEIEDSVGYMNANKATNAGSSEKFVLAAGNTQDFTNLEDGVMFALKMTDPRLSGYAMSANAPFARASNEPTKAADKAVIRGIGGHWETFIAVKYDYISPPNNNAINCGDRLMLRNSAPHQPITYFTGTPYVHFRDMTNHPTTFKPLQAVGQVWQLNNCQNTDGNKVTSSSSFNMKSDYSMLLSRTLLAFGVDTLDQSLFSLIKVDSSNGNGISDGDQVNFKYIGCQWFQPQYVSIYRGNMATMYVNTPRSDDVYTVVKVSNLISVYNEFLDMGIFCGDQILIKSAQGTYLTALSETSVQFKAPTQASGQLFVITGCNLGEPISLGSSSFTLTSQFGSSLQLSNGQVVLNKNARSSLYANDKVSSAGKLMDESYISLKFDTTPQKFLTSVKDKPAVGSDKAEFLTVVKVRQVSAVNLRYTSKSGTDDIIRCGDKVTVKNVHQAYLTENAKESTLKFLPSQASGQAWKVTGPSCKDGSSIRPDQSIQLVSETNKYLGSTNDQNDVESAPSTQIKQQDRFTFTLKSITKNTHFLTDGMRVALQMKATSRFISSLQTGITKVDLFEMNQLASLQLNKVGSDWCSFKASNWVWQPADKSIDLTISTDDKTWVAVGEGANEKLVAEVPCCGTKLIDMTPFMQQEKHNLVTFYNSHKCSGGFVQVNLDINTEREPIEAPKPAPQPPALANINTIASLPLPLYKVNADESVSELNTEKFCWSNFPANKLSQISFSNRFLIAGVASNGNIYQYNYASKQWGQLPGALKQINVHCNGDLYGVNSANNIYRYTGSNWEQLPGSLKWVSGTGKFVYGVNANDDIFHYLNNGSWEQLPGKLSQISVGCSNEVYGVNSGGNIYKLEGKDWKQVPSPYSVTVVQVQVLKDGTLLATSKERNLYFYKDAIWLQVPNDLACLCVNMNN